MVPVFWWSFAFSICEIMWSENSNNFISSFPSLMPFLSLAWLLWQLAVLIYILINNLWEFHFLYIFTTICYFLSFFIAICLWWEGVTLCFWPEFSWQLMKLSIFFFIFLVILIFLLKSPHIFDKFTVTLFFLCLPVLEFLIFFLYPEY